MSQLKALSQVSSIVGSFLCRIDRANFLMSHKDFNDACLLDTVAVWSVTDCEQFFESLEQKLKTLLRFQPQLKTLHIFLKRPVSSELFKKIFLVTNEPQKVNVRIIAYGYGSIEALHRLSTNISHRYEIDLLICSIREIDYVKTIIQNFANINLVFNQDILGIEFVKYLVINVVYGVAYPVKTVYIDNIIENVRTFAQSDIVLSNEEIAVLHSHLFPKIEYVNRHYGKDLYSPNYSILETATNIDDMVTYTSDIATQNHLDFLSKKCPRLNVLKINYIWNYMDKPLKHNLVNVLTNMNHGNDVILFKNNAVSNPLIVSTVIEILKLLNKLDTSKSTLPCGCSTKRIGIIYSINVELCSKIAHRHILSLAKSMGLEKYYSFVTDDKLPLACSCKKERSIVPFSQLLKDLETELPDLYLPWSLLKPPL